MLKKRSHISDIVIHCASVLSIAAEQDRSTAWSVNKMGSLNVATRCKELGKRLVYISTDYVFSGDVGDYCEGSSPNPVNYYGFTKWAGEVEAATAMSCPNHLILRVPFRVAPWAHPVAYSDQWTSCRWLPEVVPDILLAAQSNLTGILHIGGPRRSAFEMARESNPEIKAASRKEWTMFQLPKDVSLDSSRWASLWRPAEAKRAAR